MTPLIEVLNKFAGAGLKAYAPYTINPRPFDLYNVQTMPQEAAMVFEGYSLQTQVDYLHVRLGGLGLNTRSCACYVPDVGNIPKPGTFQTYVINDAELERVQASYSNLWSKKDARPNRFFIRCPHNTYQEIDIEDWSTGPSNLEQMRRTQKMVAAVGRLVVTGADAIAYLDIPLPQGQRNQTPG